MTATGAARLDLGEDVRDRSPPHLGEVLVDGGQGRQEGRGLGDVVEADDADVVGDPAAALVQGPQQPQRHLVVGREHRRAVRLFGDPSPAR